MPPAQDSPKHILNVLNDDCIQMCLRKLTEWQDFTSAALVCTRFQANARACFPPNLKERIWFYHEDVRSNPMALHNFLCIFGDLLQCVILWFDWDKRGKEDDDFINLLAQCCGKTLKKLSIMEYHPNKNFALEFKALEILELNHFPIINLCINADRCWFYQEIPQLSKIRFVFSEGLTNDIITGFMKLNPQLRALDVGLSVRDGVTTSILQDISDCSPNLQELSIRVDNYGASMPTYENFIHLRGLRKLTSLYINFSYNFEPFLCDLLAENNIPIVELRLLRFYDGIAGDLAKLKLLKRVSIYGARIPFDLGEIIRILERCENLTKFYTGNCFYNDVRNSHLTLAEARKNVPTSKLSGIWLHIFS